MHIVIPSRERAKWLMKKKRHTLDQTYHLKPLFMVREDDTELNDYVTLCSQYNVKMLKYDGSNIYGAAQTYDMIIDECIQNGVEKLIILDDDLTFKMHNPIVGAKPDFKLCNEFEIEKLFQHALDIVCPQVPMLSFTPIMTRNKPHIISFCKPMMMAYVYYLPHFKLYPEHRFWVGKHIEARCDLNLSLKMLTAGFLNAFMVTMFIPDNANNPGGCSTYRDIECERASVDFLKKTYPEFVNTHKKKGWVGDPDIIREAPIIQWKKAFNKEAFKNNFGIDAEDFARLTIMNYEVKYSEFIKEIRNA